MIGAPWGLRGPVSAALYAVPRAVCELGALVDRVRDGMAASARASCAVSALGDLLVVRASGAGVERVRASLIESWRVLRPALLGRDAVLPRIWAT